jgi:hypothetical protein
MIRNKLCRERGIGLVEVLMAIGLLGGASLAFVKLQENMTRGQITTETKMSELELKRMISSSLLDRNACKTTFTGKNIGATVSSIKNASNAVLFEIGKVYENNTIKINEIKTEDKNTPGPNGTRIVDLVISTSKAKGQSYSNSKVIRIPLSVVATGASAPITDCFTDVDQLMESAMRETCLSLDAVWDAVSKKCRFETFRVAKDAEERLSVHSNGNVGVGTFTPAYRLDVKGMARLYGENEFTILQIDSYSDSHPPYVITRRGKGGNMSSPTFSVAGDGLGYFEGRSLGVSAPLSGAGLRVDASENHSANSMGSRVVLKTVPNGTRTAIDRVYIQSEGNVGIGVNNPQSKLEVGGGVKMANDTAACDATKEGTQRYNSSTKNMEFCNGTAWTGIGGAGNVKMYQCPDVRSAQGVSSGPWASYGCTGQIWGSNRCLVVVHPHSQWHACTPL